jgi:hypothetical protein
MNVSSSTMLPFPFDSIDLEYGMEHDKVDFYTYHGWFLWGAWGMMGLLQIASSRYLKVFWQYNIWIHMISGSLILGLTIFFGIEGIRHNDDVFTKNWHSIFGVVALLVVPFVSALGFYARDR